MAKKLPKTARYRSIMRAFGKTLRNAREAKFDKTGELRFRSAAAFAAHINLEEATYRKYERGDSEPSYDTLIRICEELDLTPNDLIRNPADIKDKPSKKKGGSDPRAAA